MEAEGVEGVEAEKKGAGINSILRTPGGVDRRTKGGLILDGGRRTNCNSPKKGFAYMSVS